MAAFLLPKVIGMSKALAAAYASVDVLTSEGGWYAVMQVPAMQSEESLVLRILEHDHVLVHPGYFFDFPREAFLIVSLLPPPDVFDRLDPPSLAAVVSMLTYEERRADARAPTIPPPVVGRYRQLQKLATALRRAERERALPETREPDAGFAAIAYGWASGRDLANVLADDLSVGDFYRNVKMLIDLLRQLGELGAGGRLGENATRAADALERGIIEHSGPSVSADPEGAPG